MSSNLNKLEPRPNTISQQFFSVRKETENLLSNLSEEDTCVQSMTDASPAKWHAAHTTWFFETFILKQYEKHFTPSMRILSRYSTPTTTLLENSSLVTGED